MMTTPGASTNNIVRPVSEMSCALISAIACGYAADTLLFTIPHFSVLWESPYGDIGWLNRFILSSGYWILLSLSAGTALSLVLSIRNPGQRRTLIICILNLAATVVFACMANLAAWPPEARSIIDNH